MSRFQSFSPEQILSDLYVVGINHHTASISERSLFAIDDDAETGMFVEAKSKDIKSFFLLNTCNRTEIFAFCDKAEILTQLLCNYTQGNQALFNKIGFTLNGKEALLHLYRVAAGLDSQILGDDEILGQFKKAVEYANKNELIGPIMDRIINFVLQAAKAVKTNTQLSKGTTSTSFSAIQYLRKTDNPVDKHYLVVGAGKFGASVAKNITHYLQPTNLTITNRTNETAEKLATSLGKKSCPFHKLEATILEADVVLMCTNSPTAIVMPTFRFGEKPKLFLDMSVPTNVHPEVKNIANVTVVDLDELSKTTHETLENRNEAIPEAEALVAKYEQEFYDWLKMYKHAPMLKDMREKLYTLTELMSSKCEYARKFSGLSDEALNQKINKSVGTLADNLRLEDAKGCQYIVTLNDFLNKHIAVND